MITFRVDNKGFKAIEAELNQLANPTANNVIRRALLKAGEPIKKAGEERVPVRVGLMRAGIVSSTRLTKTQRKQNKKRHAAEVYVGVSGPRGPFAHLLEFGTSRTPPVGFMRQAFDTNVHRALAIFTVELKSEVEKAMERARRKAARAAGTG